VYISWLVLKIVLNTCIIIIYCNVLIVGSERNINKALKLIRVKFPEKTYPEFTLECITQLMDSSPVISQLFKVNLINNKIFLVVLKL
jgi:hypothetical protein